MNIHYHERLFARAYINHFCYRDRTVLCAGQTAHDISLGHPRDGRARFAAKRLKTPCLEIEVPAGGDPPSPEQIVWDVEQHQRWRAMFNKLADA